MFKPNLSNVRPLRLRQEDRVHTVGSVPSHEEIQGGFFFLSGHEKDVILQSENQPPLTQDSHTLTLNFKPQEPGELNTFCLGHQPRTGDWEVECCSNTHLRPLELAGSGRCSRSFASGWLIHSHL